MNIHDAARRLAARRGISLDAAYREMGRKGGRRAARARKPLIQSPEPREIRLPYAD